LSLKVDSLTMLTKALRPLPEKWHGLQDPDLQQRRRYLHLITDPTAREYVAARATVLRTIRRELDDRGYTEVETPVLQAVAGGALAKPFTTHHNALDTDLKLRISLELYLKRLLVGGLERIYEIGRNFRNEGIDREHNPEFTMLELYEAYGDYATMMRIAEDLIRASAQALKGSLTFTFRERELDLRRPSAGSRCWGRLGGHRRGGDARSPGPRGARGSPRRSRRSHVEGGKIVLRCSKLAEHTFFEPTFVCDFPRRSLRSPAPTGRIRAHRALRRHRGRDRARHGVLRAD
jgi:lysyl-tRNA synthetase class 2